MIRFFGFLFADYCLLCSGAKRLLFLNRQLSKKRSNVLKGSHIIVGIIICLAKNRSKIGH